MEAQILSSTFWNYQLSWSCCNEISRLYRCVLCR